MSVFLQPGAKRKIYWYRFMHRGQVIRRSTKQTNHKVALQLEATHKSNLAKGEAGIYDKEPAPTLAEYAKEFLSWAEGKFREKPKTWLYYRNGVRRLLEYQPLAVSALDDEQIDARLGDYILKRQADGLKNSSINRELQTLRRLLHKAKKGGKIKNHVEIETLPGEAHRERVISPEEEARYLSAATPLLAAFATVLFDSGMRPEEAYRLEWEYVQWNTGRYGSMHVTHGKSAAARRMLPMTQRVRLILESRWEEQGRPAEGWVWPGPTKSGHIEPSTLKKQHKKALKDSRVRAFVLYSLRHTFLTRLGLSGHVDAWTLGRLAGHSSVKMSLRYVHSNNDAVLAAMERGAELSGPSQGGHEFGHGGENTEMLSTGEKRLSA